MNELYFTQYTFLTVFRYFYSIKISRTEKKGRKLNYLETFEIESLNRSGLLLNDQFTIIKSLF